MKYERPLRRPSQMVEGVPSEAPTAQPQTARHGGSVEGSRGAHADGGTRHRASSRRLHRPISPWRGAGSRGTTVGRPSAHCASPGRHSEPRSSPPDRAPPRAHLPQTKDRPTRGTSSPFVGGHILRRRQHIAHRRVHIPRSRGHISRSRRHRPLGEERIEERRRHRPLSARHRPTRGTSSPTRGGHISRRRGCLDQFAVCVERK